jgi:drug/metabolite transporter (DMT)-like permease
VKGPAFLLAGIGLFSLLDANNKLLSAGYGLGQAVALRYLVLIGLFLAARAVWRGAFGPITTARPGLHLLRTASMMVSAAGFFLAFRQLPLAEGYLVFFTAPFMTLALAATVLRERVPAAAWLWCAVGFGGVLLAVAPKLGGGGPLLGYLAILVGTLGFAVTQTVNRMLRDEPGIARILFWPSVAGILIYGPFALRDWAPPPPLDLAMLLANGLLSAGAVLCTAAAFRSADAARLGPYGYAALPAAVALDLLIWGAWPNPATVAGGVVVVAACAMSERARRRAVAYGMPGGKAWSPSAPSGRAVTERTAESGSGP